MLPISRLFEMIKADQELKERLTPDDWIVVEKAYQKYVHECLVVEHGDVQVEKRIRNDWITETQAVCGRSKLTAMVKLGLAAPVPPGGSPAAPPAAPPVVFGTPPTPAPAPALPPQPPHTGSAFEFGSPDASPIFHFGANAEEGDTKKGKKHLPPPKNKVHVQMAAHTLLTLDAEGPRFRPKPINEMESVGFFQMVTAMDDYSGKSFEELRFESYTNRSRPQADVRTQLERALKRATTAEDKNHSMEKTIASKSVQAFKAEKEAEQLKIRATKAEKEAKDAKETASRLLMAEKKANDALEKLETTNKRVEEHEKKCTELVKHIISDDQVEIRGSDGNIRVAKTFLESQKGLFDKLSSLSSFKLCVLRAHIAYCLDPTAKIKTNTSCRTTSEWIKLCVLIEDFQTAKHAMALFFALRFETSAPLEAMSVICLTRDVKELQPQRNQIFDKMYANCHLPRPWFGGLRYLDRKDFFFVLCRVPDDVYTPTSKRIEIQVSAEPGTAFKAVTNQFDIKVGSKTIQAKLSVGEDESGKIKFLIGPLSNVHPLILSADLSLVDSSGRKQHVISIGMHRTHGTFYGYQDINWPAGESATHGIVVDVEVHKSTARRDLLLKWMQCNPPLLTRAGESASVARDLFASDDSLETLWWSQVDDEECDDEECDDEEDEDYPDGSPSVSLILRAVQFYFGHEYFRFRYVVREAISLFLADAIKGFDSASHFDLSRIGSDSIVPALAVFDEINPNGICATPFSSLTPPPPPPSLSVTPFAHRCRRSLPSPVPDEVGREPRLPRRLPRSGGVPQHALRPGHVRARVDGPDRPLLPTLSRARQRPPRARRPGTHRLREGHRRAARVLLPDHADAFPGPSLLCGRVHVRAGGAREAPLPLLDVAKDGGDALHQRCRAEPQPSHPHRRAEGEGRARDEGRPRRPPGAPPLPSPARGGATVGGRVGVGPHPSIGVRRAVSSSSCERV